ncbi:Oligomerization domain-containing protein [Cladochytrium replicatum]|nr:Oligomerization domain-containing protein [Cladochytrium replicatum]
MLISSPFHTTATCSLPRKLPSSRIPTPIHPEQPKIIEEEQDNFVIVEDIGEDDTELIKVPRKKRGKAPKTWITNEEDSLTAKGIKDLYDVDARAEDARENVEEIELYDARSIGHPEPEWYENLVVNADDSAAQSSATPSFIPRWAKAARIADARARGDEEDSVSKGEFDPNMDLKSARKAAAPLTVAEIVHVLKEEQRAKNIVVLDMRSKVDYMEYMIIAEGRSKKQIYSMAHAVRIRAKHRIPDDPSIPKNLEIEGEGTEDWMVLDTGRIMVHCFTPDMRATINLEGLWMAIKDPLLAAAANASKIQDDYFEVYEAPAAIHAPYRNKKTKWLDESDVPDEEELIRRMNRDFSSHRKVLKHVH